jgi:hypothetical protein
MGRSPGQAGAPQALRAAGLETALPAAELTSDVILPAPARARGPAGFINEPALLVMAGTVYSRVGHSLRAGRFPLLYGADCAVLLAAIPALRDSGGRARLLSVPPTASSPCPPRPSPRSAPSRSARRPARHPLAGDRRALPAPCDASGNPCPVTAAEAPEPPIWRVVTVTELGLTVVADRADLRGSYGSRLEPSTRRRGGSSAGSSRRARRRGLAHPGDGPSSA